MFNSLFNVDRVVHQETPMDGDTRGRLIRCLSTLPR